MKRPSSQLMILCVLFLSQPLWSQQLSNLSSWHVFDYNVQEFLNPGTQFRVAQATYNFALPLPNGEVIDFVAKENGVLSTSLRQKYPDVWSLSIRGKNNPEIYGRLIVGGQKIFATIQTPQGIVTINPSNNNPKKFVSFFGDQHPEKKESVPTLDCEQNPNDLRRVYPSGLSRLRSGIGFTNGGTLRTYRMAIVTTGGFYQNNGNNDTDVLAAITFGLNGLTMIYEKELAVSFTLVNDPFLFTNPSTDPFNPALSRTVQAANVVGANFDLNDFDIGHVLNDDLSGNWPGGGVARLEAVCNNSTFSGSTGPRKAGGWTGSFSATNGWIQLFAHEVGHMFGATHTFNGTGASCTNNIDASTAYEIGSGTTIMSYQGICQSDNNIPSSGTADNYFHANSLNQMTNYITLNGTGSSCAASTATNNDVPIADANPTNGNYTIPINTPFEITGAGVDIQQQNLTYCWEQFDEDGPDSPTQGLLGLDAALDARAPLFRSFPPSTEPTRIFPNLAQILAGNNTGVTFEALSSVDRSINLALTVRDNQAGGGAISCDLLTIQVEDRGGAFEVTTQNTSTSLVANGSSTFIINWNVAGTDGGNIGATNVDILFSTDGGLTFPFTLLANTSNDGTESVIIPSLPTTQGRIKIKASNNIFFDINNADITISSSCIADGSTFSPDNNRSAPVGDPSLDLNLNPNYGSVVNTFSGDLEVTDDSSIDLVFDQQNGTCMPTNSSYYEIYDVYVATAGTYTFNITGSFGKVMNIYQDTYDPNNVCTNWLASSATRATTSGSVFLNASVSVDLNPGIKYQLVVQTFNQSNASYLGAYTVTPSGGPMFDGVPNPGGSFNYTYVIINEDSGHIVAFEDDPDLSISATYPSGCYTIYGLSYENLSLTTPDLNTNYSGSSFAGFLTAILNNSICGNLSSNQKEVIISDCDAEAGAISPASPINAYEGSTLLDLSLSPDFSGVNMPSTDFSYTYLILNAADLAILAFEDDPDLSDVNNYPPGAYLIYGISYDNNGGNETSSTLNTTYANQPWSLFRNGLTTKNFCADTSSNNILLTISDCNAEANVFAPDTDLSANVGNPVLDLNMNPIFGTPISGFNGSLENTDDTSIDIVFDQDGGTCIPTNNSFYDSYTFYVSETGFYDISFSGVFGQLLNIYQGIYDPNNVCNNWIASSAERSGGSGPVTLTSSASANLSPGIAYTVVIQTFSTGDPDYLGAYSINFAGPGAIATNVTGPGINYGYTYLIVDDLTGEIVAFEDDPNLSVSRTYPAGTYTIYGLSYEITVSGNSVLDLNNQFAGMLFSSFQAAIATPDICADLSDNARAITIFSCPENKNIQLCEGVEVAYDLTNLLNGAQVTGSWNQTGGDMVDIGNPASVDFSTASPGLYTFTFTFAGNGVCTGGMIEIDITIIENVDHTLEVSNDQICTVEVATINILSTELDVEYQLRLDDNDTPVGSPISGNGGTITFMVQPAVTTTYNVLATNTNTGCSLELLNKPIVTETGACCNASLTIEASVFLEGAAIDAQGANSFSLPLRTSMNDGRLLPGQVGPIFIGIYNAPGQPYNSEPWDYFGTEGDTFDSGGDQNNSDANYPSTVVDWVLVSLRSDPNNVNNPSCRAAALLHEDGTIEFVEDLDCCDLDQNQSYYLAVEHRNHLIVMSPNPLPIINGKISYDFRVNQSFNSFPGFFVGQKPIMINGTQYYMMYGGNGFQSGNVLGASTDITSDDLPFWELSTGTQFRYVIGDFNLSGDTNANDRSIYENNEGSTSSVPNN